MLLSMAWASTREGLPTREAALTRAARRAAPPCRLAAPEGRQTPGKGPTGLAAERVMAKAQGALRRYRLRRRLPRDRYAGQLGGGDQAAMGGVQASPTERGHGPGVGVLRHWPGGTNLSPGAGPFQKTACQAGPPSGRGPAAIAALACLHHAHHRAHHHRQGIVVLVTALELGVENPLSRAGRTTAGTAAGGGTQLVGGQGIQGSSTGNPWILANEVLKRWPQGKSLMRRQAGRPQPGDGGQPGASG